ncbi:hypothetical protein GCM10017668_53840 [Streptomyces tuirus]|uniref:Uncharacterized protein n=1 Tax=Streptomyces tuirus TaxID=68278 RepID=A0A7G1NLT4_9ACTN|nr:hypothetical protein GCM10017668_53840 [Streptomyces tuirus]
MWSAWRFWSLRRRASDQLVLHVRRFRAGYVDMGVGFTVTAQIERPVSGARPDRPGQVMMRGL